MTRETVLVERLDGAGRVLGRERLVLEADRRSFTIGRGIEADVVLDDEHAGPLHALVDVASGGRLLVTDLGSLNGIVVAGQRVAGARARPLPDNCLRIGRTHLRVRTVHEKLAPEKPDQRAEERFAGAAGRIAAAAGVLVAAQLAYGVWFSAPRELSVGIVSVLGVTAVSIAAWVGAWGLLTRVLRGEWRWPTHLAICLGLTALVGALAGALDLGRFMVWAPPGGGLQIWLGALALAAALFLHLVTASSLSRARAGLAVCLVSAVLGGGSVWMSSRAAKLDVNAIDSRLALYPAGFRLRAAESRAVFSGRLDGLRARTDSKLKAAISDDPDDEGK